MYYVLFYFIVYPCWKSSSASRWISFHAKPTFSLGATLVSAPQSQSPPTVRVAPPYFKISTPPPFYEHLTYLPYSTLLFGPTEPRHFLTKCLVLVAVHSFTIIPFNLNDHKLYLPARYLQYLPEEQQFGMFVTSRWLATCQLTEQSCPILFSLQEPNHTNYFLSQNSSSCYLSQELIKRCLL